MYFPSCPLFTVGEISQQHKKSVCKWQLCCCFSQHQDQKGVLPSQMPMTESKRKKLKAPIQQISIFCVLNEEIEKMHLYSLSSQWTPGS